MSLPHPQKPPKTPTKQRLTPKVTSYGYRVQPWHYPWPAQGWEAAVQAIFDPPVPLRNGRFLRVEVAQCRAMLAEVLAGVEFPAGVQVHERLTLAFELGDGAGFRQTFHAESQGRLRQALARAVPVEGARLKTWVKVAWVEGVGVLDGYTLTRLPLA